MASGEEMAKEPSCGSTLDDLVAKFVLPEAVPGPWLLGGPSQAVTWERAVAWEPVL